MVMQVAVGQSFRTFDLTDIALEDVAGVPDESSVRPQDADVYFKL
jgi:hypothetical protein